MNYDHYIGLDWAQANMAIARYSKTGKLLDLIDVDSDIRELQIYLKSLKGKIALTLEESTSSQWLYTELNHFVDKLVICDPRRNALLKHGPKTDKIDAEKLAKLLMADLLKPVFHSGNEFIYLRRIVSAYEDLTKSGTRVKNQRAALFRCNGKKKTDKELEGKSNNFVLQGLDSAIEAYEFEKKRYAKEFAKLVKKSKMMRNLKSIPGIHDTGAVKVASSVVDPKRFKTKGQFLSYSGLIKHERKSGGKIYGRSNFSYNINLKNVFKTAAMAAIVEHSNNPLRDYYVYLRLSKSMSENEARHAVARRVAVLAYGIMKSGKKLTVKRNWNIDKGKI